MIKISEQQKERFEFLGLNFHSLTLTQSIEHLKYFIHTGKPHMIFTPTAELIVRACESESLRQIYHNTDLLTVDGFVVYYAARLFGKPIKEPVSAVRLMSSFLKVIEKEKWRLYLLGATEEVVNKVVKNLQEEYPGINIVGWHNGYFDFETDTTIVQEIKGKNPDVLFVAMSSPLKENFINKHLKEMNIPVNLGVGGSFDIIAGKCKLAPEWISKIGLEWLYRLIQEPRRLWKRYLVTNTKFLCLLVKEFLKVKGSRYGRIQEML